MTEPTRRELRTITRQALNRILSGPSDPVTQDMRDQAAAALAQLDGRASAPAEPDQWRLRVGPDLAVVIDASGCIVLEVSEGELPGARVLRRVTVTDVSAVFEALTLARLHVGMDDSYQDSFREIRPCGGQERHSGHEYSGGGRWCEGIA